MSEQENKPNSHRPEPFQPGNRDWRTKFANAFRGIRQGMAGQNSFLVHLPIALVVLVLAIVFQVSLERWCLLLICIGVVITAELFNSSLEWLSSSVTTQFDTNVERALNIASGAVLVVSIVAATIGVLIFAAAIL